MEDRPVRYHYQLIADFLRQLARINREINAYHFNDVFDAYWETPSEFRQLGGQCRDYAVATMPGSMTWAWLTQTWSSRPCGS